MGTRSIAALSWEARFMPLSLAHIVHLPLLWFIPLISGCGAVFHHKPPTIDALCLEHVSSFLKLSENFSSDSGLTPNRGAEPQGLTGEEGRAPAGPGLCLLSNSPGFAVPLGARPELCRGLFSLSWSSFARPIRILILLFSTLFADN